MFVGSISVASPGGMDTTPLLVLWSRGQSQVTYARKKFYRWSTGTTIDFQYMDFLLSLFPSPLPSSGRQVGLDMSDRTSLSFLK